MDNNVILIYLFKKKIFPNNRNLQTYIYKKKKNLHLQKGTDVYVKKMMMIAFHVTKHV